jgi:hypothetical protein
MVSPPVVTAVHMPGLRQPPGSPLRPAGEEGTAELGTGLGPELMRQVVEDGIRRYFAERRLRVRPFVDRHFSLRGALAIHRTALGWDLARAPLNIVLGLPHTLLRLTTAGARRLGAKRIAAVLGERNLLLRTRVAKEIGWLLCAELLELPCREAERESRHDALAETILADPRVADPLRDALAAIGRRADDPAFRARLQDAMRTYAGTRAAAAEIATGLMTLGAGALALKQLTPGAVSLGPALAAIMVQQAAVASFPLGSALGAIWYGLFPVVPSATLIAGLTGGMMVAAAGFAALAGIVTDPLQRRLGLHEKRLLRMLDALERQMLDPAAPRFTVRDHYVARLMDLCDLLGCAYRLT